MDAKQKRHRATAKYKAGDALRQKRYKAIRNEMVRALKLERGCADCGYKAHATALQFDHVRGEKLFNIASPHGQSCKLDRLLAEIAKCEVVCANCHAIRTYNRRKS